MKTNHTPGPWGISGNRIYAANKPICSIPTRFNDENNEWEYSSPENEANAKLIAAAPELLEALQLFVNSGLVTEESDAMKLGRAAIEKAQK